MSKGKRKKLLDKKTKKAVTVAFVVIVATMSVASILQITGIYTFVDFEVLDAENEGFGTITSTLSTSAEAQSITIENINSITKLDLKITRDYIPDTGVKVKVTIKRAGLEGQELWSTQFDYDNLGYFYIPERHWISEPGALGDELYINPPIPVTPDEQIFVIYQLMEDLPTDAHLVFLLDRATDYDRYTGGCEYHKGPGTNQQWIANYASETWLDHSFKVYGTTTNNPPNTPNPPTGPSQGEIGHWYWFDAFTTDPEGDSVRYQYDWGDGQQTAWSDSAHHTHGWTSQGNYNIKVRAKDSYDAISEWSQPLVIAISEQVTNNPPSNPTITGPITAVAGQPATWSACSTDPDGNSIFYRWYIDGVFAGESGWFPSGHCDSFQYTFSSGGTYELCAYARDEHYEESGETCKTIYVSGGGGGISLSIQALDSGSSSPIVTAQVECNGETKTVDGNGMAVFNVASGTYTATATATGYTQAVLDNIVVGTQNVFKEIYLTPSGGGGGGTLTLTVAVKDEYSIPMKDVSVFVDDEEKFTDFSGQISFEVTKNENHVVSAYKSGYDVAVRTVNHDDDAVEQFTLKRKDTSGATPGFELITVLGVISIVMIGILVKRNGKKKK